MAINKRKILQSAQKHLQKGSLDRALKDYKTLLEADPRDVNIRLKIGDIHLRQGKTEEAVNAYLKVAQQFTKDGFDAKAVALYKQITKIDAKRHDVMVPLAELYHRLGLTSDAMKALQAAADANYRDGDKRAALEVLRQMATLDPGNTTNRLKVAELLRQEGMKEEALSEYRECAAEIERQGDPEGQLRVLEKIVELVPGDVEAWRTTGRANLSLSRWSGAEKVGNHLLEHFPESVVEAYEILVEACTGLRREDELPGLYERMAQALRDRGEEDRAREILQLHAPPQELGSSDDESLETGGDDLLFGDDELETDIGVPESPSGAGKAAKPEPVIAAPPPPDPAVMDAPAGDGDVDQLFAEASVFRRYGKQDRAIESLRAILAQEPQDGAVLLQLGEAFEGCEARPEAVEAFCRAARAARATGDDPAFASLRARVEALDPATAAAELGAAPAAASAPEAPTPEDLDIELEIDLEATSDDAVELEAATPVEDGIQIELDEPPDLAEITGAPAAAAPSESLPQAEATSPGGLDLEFDFDDGSDDEEAAAPSAEPDDVAVLDDEPDVVAPVEAEAPPAAGAPEPDGEFTAPERLAEALDEAGFYFQQGLFDESEAVYRRILESAPSHPQALLRLGEIEAARVSEADEASAAAGPELEDVTEERTAPVLEDTALDTAEFEAPDIDLGSSVSDEENTEDDFGAALAAALEEDEEEDQTAPVEADAGLALDFDEDGDDSLEEALAAAAASVDGAADSVLGTAATAEVDEIDEIAEVDEIDEVDESGDFDLAKELSGVFHDEDEEEAAPAAAPAAEVGFESVFAAFKKGVDQTLDDGDHEARYDLGIAYKEMGLLDDAMSQFRAALAGDVRRLDSLHMLGVCALEAGLGADAISHLEQALSLQDVPAQHQLGLRFDLGRAYQAQGDRDRAREAWQAVADVDPEFCDVRDHLAGLDGLGGGPPDSEFESFADLVALAEEDDDGGAAGASGGYESFEDLMADAEEELDDGRVPVAAVSMEPEAPLLEAVPVEPEPEVPLEPEPFEEPEAELEPEPFEDLEPMEAEPADADADAEEFPAEPEAAEPEPAEPEPEDPPGGRKKRRKKNKKISFV